MDRFTAGVAPPATVATIRSARAGPIPGTDATSSTEASRSRFTDPNRAISAVRRAGPSPGTSSRTLVVIRLERFCGW